MNITTCLKVADTNLEMRKQKIKNFKKKKKELLEIILMACL